MACNPCLLDDLLLLLSLLLCTVILVCVMVRVGGASSATLSFSVLLTAAYNSSTMCGGISGASSSSLTWLFLLLLTIAYISSIASSVSFRTFFWNVSRNWWTIHKFMDNMFIIPHFLTLPFLTLVNNCICNFSRNWLWLVQYQPHSLDYVNGASQCQCRSVICSEHLVVVTSHAH